MIRLSIRFTGRVQGVGFRATCRSIAGRHPVTGWVRNDPDGAVSMEVQGAETAVRAFLADVRSALARFIRDEAAQPMPADPEDRGFDVRH